jgi:hypothetical protein
MKNQGDTIGKKLKQKLEEQVINPLREVFGTNTAKRIQKVSNEEVFLNEIEQLKPELSEICRNNKGILGIDNLQHLSEEETKKTARAFIDGFEKTQENPKVRDEVANTLKQLDEKLSKLDGSSKKKLCQEITESYHKKGMREKLGQFLKRQFGIDIDNLMQSLISKIGINNKDDDKNKVKTESEEMDDTLDFKTVTVFKGAIVSSAIFSPVFATIGLGAATSGIIPIAIMGLPVLVMYDSYQLVKKSCGSPFAESTFHNLVQSVETGKSYGPKIVSPEEFKENNNQGRSRD